MMRRSKHILFDKILSCFWFERRGDHVNCRTFNNELAMLSRCKRHLAEFLKYKL